MNKHPEPLFQKRTFSPPGRINFANIFITPPKTFQFDLGVAGKEILTLPALYRSCQFLPLSDRTNTRNQKAGESIDRYITDLRTKGKTCEFGTLCESLIHDRVVCGIMDDKLRARLLRESELTLKKAIDICRATEVSLEQAKSLTSAQEEMSPKINAVKRDQQNGLTKYKHRKNNREYQEKYWPIEFHVVNRNVPNILGLTTCLELNFRTVQ